MVDTSQAPGAPLRVGDHLALDFINTRYGTGIASRECFVDDASVVVWLKEFGLLPNSFRGAPDGLLELALELREKSRLLIEAAKANRGSDAGVVNKVLEEGRPTRVLEWKTEAKRYEVVSKRRGADSACLLEPVAAAIADLVASASLTDVRQCEAHDCTLLFKDLTKAHRRRWCSMALCGNRMKVAAFRERKKLG